jgi:hypothetical protein
MCQAYIKLAPSPQTTVPGNVESISESSVHQCCASIIGPDLACDQHSGYSNVWFSCLVVWHISRLRRRVAWLGAADTERGRDKWTINYVCTCK